MVWRQWAGLELQICIGELLPKPKFSMFCVLSQNSQHCFEKWYTCKHPKEIARETQKWHYNFSRPSSSWVIDQTIFYMFWSITQKLSRQILIKIDSCHLGRFLSKSSLVIFTRPSKIVLKNVLKLRGTKDIRGSDIDGFLRSSSSSPGYVAGDYPQTEVLFPLFPWDPSNKLALHWCLWRLSKMQLSLSTDWCPFIPPKVWFRHWMEVLQGCRQPHSPGWARVPLSSFFPQISIKFSYFSSNFFFLILALRVGESPTQEGPGYATEVLCNKKEEMMMRVLRCIQSLVNLEILGFCSINCIHFLFSYPSENQWTWSSEICDEMVKLL